MVFAEPSNAESIEDRHEVAPQDCSDAFPRQEPWTRLEGALLHPLGLHPCSSDVNYVMGVKVNILTYYDLVYLGMVG